MDESFIYERLKALIAGKDIAEMYGLDSIFSYALFSLNHCHKIFFSAVQINIIR